MSALGNLIAQLKAEDWISTTLDRKLTGDDGGGGWVRRPTLNIHPSSAGSVCVRSHQIGMLGYRDPRLPKSQRRMDNGTYSHDRWTDEFRRAGLLAEANVKLRVDDPPWSGEVDLIAVHPVHQTRHIVEIKTMGSFAYKRLPRQGDPLQTAKVLAVHQPGYVYQMAQYMIMFGAYRGPISDVAYMLVEDTADQDYRVLALRFDEGLRTAALRVPLEAQRLLREGKLADPPFRRKSPTCRACYKEAICYRLQDGNAADTEAVAKALEVLGG